MKRSSLLSTMLLALPVTVATGACSSEPAPVTPETPTATTVPTAAPTAEPVASDEPTAEPTATPDDPPPTRKPSGRPATKFGPSEGELVQTCGSTPATVLQLKVKESPEPASLVITEWALPTGYNITWKPQPKAPAGQKPQFGPMFQTIVQEAGEATPIKVTSEGPPFEFRIPLFGKETLNLAIGEISLDDKGKEKVAWTVFAPAQVDKGLGYAAFQVPSLGHAYVHATGAAPTAAATPAP